MKKKKNETEFDSIEIAARQILDNKRKAAKNGQLSQSQNSYLKYTFGSLLFLVTTAVLYFTMGKINSGSIHELENLADVSFGIYLLSFAFLTFLVLKNIKLKVSVSGEWLIISRFPDFKVKYHLSLVKRCVINSFCRESDPAARNILQNNTAKSYYINTNCGVLVYLSNGTCQVIGSKNNNLISKIFISPMAAERK